MTFADYMGLDNYFRRQAARSASLKQTTLKLIREALDLIFGFLPAEMKGWLDAALAKDRMQVFAISFMMNNSHTCSVGNWLVS